MSFIEQWIYTKMNKTKISMIFFSLLVLRNITFSNSNSNELLSAYTWAYNNWITTQSTIDKANMNWDITRIELSKMISNYVINVLKKTSDTSRRCIFTDITSELDYQYDNWVTKACQLWLMWQWITKFRPYDKVTRAEFWTILSRALYWEKYNWWNPYYQRHLNQLNITWIMKNISNAENRKEIRWYVMLMMMRSKGGKNNISFQDMYEKIILSWWFYIDWVLHTEYSKHWIFEVPSNWEYETFSSEYVAKHQDVFPLKNKANINLYYEDNNYYYFFDGPLWYHEEWVWTKKDKLKDFLLIWALWTQSYEEPIGYSNWYIILPPYKFPVDKWSFIAYPDEWWDNTKPNKGTDRENWVKKDWGHNFCFNNGKQYEYCFWSDKDYIYRWEYSYNDKIYHIIRDKKMTDFKVLSPDEII